jgi:sortase A
MVRHPSDGWDFSAAAARPAGGLGASPPASAQPTSDTGESGRGTHRTGDVARAIARAVGQTLITLGVVVLLFVVYEVWISNLFAHRKQEAVHQQLAQAWQKGQDPLHGEDRLNLPSGKQVVIPAGVGFANLYVPRFGKDFAWTIVQGTDDSALERGPGHYVGTSLPGQIGNFSLAGHRVGKGEPFLNLDQLQPGDPIVVQTETNWYIYRVLGSAQQDAAAQQISTKKQRDQAIAAALASSDSQGVVGREIVSPSAVDVIDPVPNRPGVAPTRALLTLTTCHPKYTANQRMIIHAALQRAVPVKGTATPRELAGGTL